MTALINLSQNSPKFRLVKFAAFKTEISFEGSINSAGKSFNKKNLKNSKVLALKDFQKGTC